DRLVLAKTIVIARDGAGADVCLRADRRVAQIRVVVRFRTRHHVRLLGLDEVTDPRILVEARARPAVAERTDLYALADRGFGHDRVGLDVAVVGDADVDEHRPAIDAHVIADARLAAQHDVRAEPHVLPDRRDVGIDVRRARIDHRDAGAHPRFIDAPARLR